MREGMNRQDYINAILEQIDSKQVRAEIEKELSAHIDDREEYYREIGYDSETAAQKALERMGSPEAAADGFNKVHQKYRLALAILAVIMSGFVVLFFWIMIISHIDNSVMDAGITEALILMYVIGLSVLGKRRNSRILCAVAVIDFILMYGIYLHEMIIDHIDELCSRIVLKLTCLLTLDFECLSGFWRVGRITVAPYLTYLSIVFYTAVFITLILVLISVGKLKKPTYSLREKHFACKVFKAQKVIWLFIAATILILPVGPFDEKEGMTVKTNTGINSIMIAQSDTPCPKSEIPDEDIYVIGIDRYDDITDSGYYIYTFEHFSPDSDEITVESTKCDFITKEFKNKLKYEVQKDNMQCLLTKDYVYIEFSPLSSSTINDNAYEFSSDTPENWYEVESAGEISAAVDGYNQIEITVSKKSP